MSVVNKIFTNTLWQVIFRFINILIGVFSLALITRILGQTGFGFYTTIFAFVQIFMIIADLGLYLTLLREISAAPDRSAANRATNNIFTIRLLASLLVLILIPFTIQFFPYDPVVKNGVLYFMLVFFFQSFISTLTAVFSKKLAMPKVAIVDFVSKALYVLALVYLFKSGAHLNEVLLYNCLTQFLALILLLVFLKKYIDLKLAWDFVYWREIFHSTWPLAVTVVLNLLYFKADTLVLSIYRPPAEVGLYGAPYRILEAISSFPHMFMSLILPLFTTAWLSKDMYRLKQIFQHSFDFFSMAIVGMITVTWLISQPLMIALAGPDFAASGGILNILIVATGSIFFGTLFTYMVVALKSQKQMIKYFLIAAVVGMLGYFVFIPKFSYWGAAYMTLLVETLIVIFAYQVVRKHLALKISFKVLGKSLMAGAITLLLFWNWREHNLIIILFLSSLIYLSLLLLIKAIDKKQIKELFNKAA